MHQEQPTEVFTSVLGEIESDESLDIQEFFSDADVDFDDKFVKNNLREILLLLLYDSGGANGKQLTDTVASLFGTVVSSGTLYPELYDLEENGLLTTREHIRTKEYRIQDEEQVKTELQGWLKQHLVLGVAVTDLS